MLYCCSTRYWPSWWRNNVFFIFIFLQLLKASFLRHMNSMFSTSPCSYSSMTIQMGSTSMTPMRRTMWGWSRFFIKPVADRAESVTSDQSDVRIYQKKLPSVSVKTNEQQWKVCPFTSVTYMNRPGFSLTLLWKPQWDWDRPQCLCFQLFGLKSRKKKTKSRASMCCGWATVNQR